MPELHAGAGLTIDERQRSSETALNTNCQRAFDFKEVEWRFQHLDARGVGTYEIKSWRSPFQPGRRQEEAEAEMARMAKAQWSANRGGERDAESACRPATAVVIALAAEALELYRPKPVRADQLLIFDGDECWQA